MISNVRESLVEHHTKYKEIHGVDETVWMTKSNHRKLHIRLREDGICNVSSAELAKISHAANNRTAKGKKYISVYQKKNVDQIYFTENMMSCVRFHEIIKYNNKTGVVCCSANFRGTGGKKLFFVDVQ